MAACTAGTARATSEPAAAQPAARRRVDDLLSDLMIGTVVAIPGSIGIAPDYLTAPIT